eukprot:TRINITY_DN17760_c1_g1_i1.p1 TRINITY_DN17760_c1_g1~~TRINITY_DN17760_c1_g1_i1.p1  ORF type:complete len:766 (-),score=160.44 TRINITY_DN17760_c1_g1_i1:205-2388(-)
MAGFRDLAFLDRLKSLPLDAKAGGISADVGPMEGHEMIPAWQPSCDSQVLSTCAAFTTLRLTGYPWPAILDTTADWASHHLALGFSPLLIFLDESDTDKVHHLKERLSTIGLCDSILLIEEEEMRSSWKEAPSDLMAEFYDKVETELSAKQILNCNSALQRCARHGGIDWLFCNLDIDEAFYFGSEDDGSVQKHFGAVAEDVWQILYMNHEAVVPQTPARTWFEQVELFKLSPLTKLPFISGRFPECDEEPQILEHPDGLGNKTLEFWQAHNSRLADQYGFKKRAGGGTCSYFDGYARGKVAIRISTAIETKAIPRVHRWKLPTQASTLATAPDTAATSSESQAATATETSPPSPPPPPPPSGTETSKWKLTVCSPACASILHYINCGGAEWFAAKYAMRAAESANRLWFHVLAQERAQAGQEALQELHDDVFSVGEEALKPQIEEGLIAPLGLPCSPVGSSSSAACATAFHGFWGWAAVALGASLYVHVPLNSDGVPLVSNEEANLYDVESDISRLPTAELQTACSAFYNAYHELDGGKISKQGRDHSDGKKDLELTYAEVEFVPFWYVLSHVVKPQAGECFLDLGSGTGRGVLVAALAFPELRSCIGYEIVETLHEAAEQAASFAQNASLPCAPIDLRCSSFCGASWELEDISIVFVASLCMRPETIEEIRARALRLRSGARVITMDPFFGESIAELEPVLVNGSPKITVQMSFGDASLYVWRLI